MEANIQSKNANQKGWNRNTHLGVNLKTILCSDRCAKTGKGYPGMLRRDVPCVDFGFDDPHFTFIESASTGSRKRNPHVFKGGFITVTRRDDGSFQPNFRPIPKGKGFSLERYAQGVYNELCIALGGLIGESE